MSIGVHQDEDRLLELAYGELPAHEASAVEAHVRGCPRCAASLEQIRSVRATMKQLAPVPAPDAGLESLLAYAEQTAKRNAAGPKAQVPWWRRVVAPLAGVTALGLVGVVAWKNQQLAEEASPAKVAAEKTRERQETASSIDNSLSPVAEDQAAAPPPPVAAAPKEGQGYEQALGATRDPKARDEALGSLLEKSTKISKGKRDALGLDSNGLGELGTGRAGGGAALADKAAKAGPAAQKPADDSQDFETTFAPKKEAVAKNDTVLDDLKVAAERKVAAVPPAAPKPVASAPMPAPKPEPKKLEQRADWGNAGRGVASTGSAETEAAPTSAPAQAQAPAAAAPGGSMGLSIGTTSRSRANEESAKDNDEVLVADGRKQQVEADLSRARSAASSGDRSGEVKLSLAALESGATGYQRAEALKRLCDAYEALGAPEQADKYCAQLLKEFPDTAAARAVSDRKQQQLRAAPSKRSQRYSEDAYESAPATKKAKSKAPASKATSAD